MAGVFGGATLEPGAQRTRTLTRQSLWNKIWTRGQESQGALPQMSDPLATAQDTGNASNDLAQTSTSTGGDRRWDTENTYTIRTGGARRDETRSEENVKTESSRSTAWIPKVKLEDRNPVIRLSKDDDDPSSVIEDGERRRAGIRHSSPFGLR
jgi:hypothetical protein